MPAVRVDSRLQPQMHSSADPHSSARIWAELHEKAFRPARWRVTRLIVLDNLREGVLKPDIYDPTINRSTATCWHTMALSPCPCRVVDPGSKRQGRGRSRTRPENPLKGQRFEKLEDAQTYLDHWEERWPTRAFTARPSRRWRPCCRRTPLVVAPTAGAFRYYQYGERVVHLDGCVEIEAAYYSVPPGWIGRRVHVHGIFSGSA